MLVIKPIEDKSIQRELVAKCGGTYIDTALAYAAYDCEDDSVTVRYPIGVCQFSLSGTDGVIDTLRTCPGVEDDEAMMIMARACTAFLYRCGFVQALIPQDGADDILVKQLGFLRDESGVAHLDIVKYYTGPCHGEQQ